MVGTLAPPPDSAVAAPNRMIFPSVQPPRPFHVRSAERSLEVALITEGTYPFHDGGVSVWCDQLVRGLAPDRFHIEAITAGLDDKIFWQLPDNVVALRRIALWGRGAKPRPGQHLDPNLRSTLRTFFMATVGREPPQAFRASLQRIAEVAPSGVIAGALGSNEAVELVLAAMNEAPINRGVEGTPSKPTVTDAVHVLTLLEHFLRPLTVAPAPVVLSHASSNGLCALPAMAAAWAHGTPFLLTEHGVYLRERYIEYAPGKLPHSQRLFLLGFYRRLAKAAYDMADAIAPGSDYNRRWQQAAGADADKIEPIHNGIDAGAFTADQTTTEHPTLVWVGRIDPLKDVKTLLRAFARVHQAMPAARLRIFGGTPIGNEPYLAECQALRAELELTEIATFEGRVKSIADAYLAGDVVVATSISEGFPYAVLEAMASGRAMIATDVGGVNEAIDDSGILVPPQDEESLAVACTSLLTDPRRRADLATRGRDRVLRHFMVELSNERYGALYDDLVDGVRGSAKGVRP